MCNTGCNIAGAGGLAAAAFDLCKACDARLDLVTVRIFFQVITELIVMADGVWAWSDQAHFPTQDVYELWEFVQ